MMKVKEIIRVVDIKTKVAFVKNNRPYHIGDSMAQQFYKLEQILKDEKLMDSDVSILKGAGKDALVIKLKKEN